MLEESRARRRLAPADAWTQATFEIKAIARAAAYRDEELADWAARQMIEHDSRYAGAHYARALVARAARERQKNRTYRARFGGTILGEGRPRLTRTSNHTRNTTMRRMYAILALVLTALPPSSNAIAQSGKVDITGKWTFNVQTDAGSGTPTVTFKQDGEKLTGHYSSQTFGEQDFTGSIKGSDFKFNFSADVQGNSLSVTYTGTVESKDALKGSVDLGGLGQGSFTAKRQ